MQYDLIVIGAGSGGELELHEYAQAGKSVAIVEYQALGGTCVNIGCVPKKLFVYASHFAEQFKDAKGYGWQVGDLPLFSWEKLLEHKNKEISRLNAIYQSLLESAGVTLYQGRAHLISTNEVSVDNEKILQAENVLIATGSVPFIPNIPGKEFIDSSEQMFYLKSLPKSIVIVGGGYIAVEFAGIFAGLGVNTDLIYRGDLFLRGFDYDIRRKLHQEMMKKGVNVLFNTEVEAIVESTSGELDVQLVKQDSIQTERVLYATGRVPNTQDMGLEALGIQMDQQGAIMVNDHFQTNKPSIYALGDVINRVQLTPVAIEEAMVLTNQLYGDQNKHISYEHIPSAVFSQPNIAVVGLTEEEARLLAEKENFEIEIFESEFKAMKFSLTDNSERTYMKLIVNKHSDKILGIHMLGDSAAEIIQGLAISLKMGATKSDFDATIGIHPSSAEEFVTMRSPK